MSFAWRNSSIADVMTHYEIEALLSPLMRLAQKTLQTSQIAIRLNDDMSFILNENAMLVSTTLEQKTLLDCLSKPGNEVGLSSIVKNNCHTSSDYIGCNLDTIHAFVAIPMQLVTGQILGTFFAIQNEARTWSKSDLSIIHDFAMLAARDMNLHLRLAVSKHKQTASAVNHKIFHQIAQSLTDAIIILDNKAEVLYTNRAIFTIFGYHPTELIGQPIERLMQTTFQEGVAFIKNVLVDESDTLAWHGIRMQGQHRDGTLIPIEITMDKFEEDDQIYLKLIVRDVTKQVNLEDELLADSQRYKQILDAIPDIVYLKDTESRLVWANRAFQDFFDIPLDALIGEVQVDGIGSVDMTESLNDDQAVFTSSTTQTTEETIIRHDGVQRQLVTTKTPIFDRSQDVHLLVGVSMDVTETKQLEKYLMDALQQRQELVDLKTNFIATVSHEFRTPLSVILSSIEILQVYNDRLSEDKRLAKLTTMTEQVQRLTHLMDQVLLINEGTVQGLACNPEYINLDALTNNIIEEIKITQGVSDVNVAPTYLGTDNRLWIDPNLYRHILQNLLSNAMKYSKPQSEVSLRITASSKQVTIAVADTGIGIPEQNQEKLYQTFHRADNVGTIHGTGLGLSIVKRAVDAHGGTINFRSVEDQGTLFVVTLPIINKETRD